MSAGGLTAAYAECEQITRDAARNFYYGIRLLPPAKRTALCAIYAFARRLDDIGDGDLPHDEKVTGLKQARADLAAVSPDSADPVLAALGDTVRRFPVPQGAFGELIDGVEMDLEGVTYATFDDLVAYCRCVAGAVGRLCLGVFGADGSRAPGPRAAELADDLGIALQQTNILRDIREDLAAGRVYLPADDLAAFGVTLGIGPDGRLGGPPDALATLVRAGAARAEQWYGRGLELLPLLDRRSAACCGAMAGIYRRLNRRIAADPAAVQTGRMSLPAREKLTVAVRSLSGVGP